MLLPMARPLRLEHPGAIWHVTSRGNARQAIVRDDVDRNRFVKTLGHVIPSVQRRFREFVSEGRNVDYQPWAELRGRGCVGRAVSSSLWPNGSGSSTSARRCRALSVFSRRDPALKP